MENPDPNPNPKDPPVHPKEQEGAHEGGGGEEEQDDDEVDEEEEEEEEESRPQSRPSRTPFANLSQVDRDLALARTLQEQERAYMMLRMGGEYAASESGSEYDPEEYEGQENGPRAVAEYGSVQEGSEHVEEDVEDDNAFDVQEGGLEIDPTEYADDEAYARALQEAEEQEVAVRLMALTGINDWVTEEREDHGSNSQEMPSRSSNRRRACVDRSLVMARLHAMEQPSRKEVRWRCCIPCGGMKRARRAWQCTHCLHHRSRSVRQRQWRRQDCGRHVKAERVPAAIAR